jgi:pimeloyl-ACP methyl ester carboxylesterase
VDSLLNNWPSHPDKVDNLILYTTSCGGPSDRPTPPEIMKIITNSSMSPQERVLKDIPFLFPPTSWFKAHPDYLNYFPIPKETISHQSLLKQLEAATTWKGTCNALSNVTKSTLVIVGADDGAAPDSLTLAEKIPGFWFIRIGTAGHGLMYQHPDVFNKLVLTFLENSKDEKIVN